MARKPLSGRPAQILKFIREELQTKGYAPTVREIGREVGLKSPRSVQLHLETLEREGYITRAERTSRSIQLTDRPRGLRLLGHVPAGIPIDAVEDAEPFDFEAHYNAEDHFMLKVHGDSMIEDHIADGDMVVVRKQATCRNGDIVVARTPDGEVTLKRFYRTKHRIRLQPANKAMKPIYCRSVEILGVVVGVVRQMA
ncbi:MAG TPA: repressor LexA [Planctomycetaceae bacterium]|nr:repressor LexA [Planctomycetaceae bacterium]